MADRFALRLALFYIGLFVALGVHLPFFPVWLAAKGLDSRAIGLVLAAPMVIRIFAVPVAARVADRFGALRGAVVAAAVAAPIGYVLVGLGGSLWTILAAFALASATFSATFPLADAYALRGLALRRQAYGPVRLWGSAAFIAGSLGAGLIADLIAPSDLIWVMVAAFTASAVASAGLAPVGTDPAAPKPSVAAAGILRSPACLAVMAAASLIQASHTVYYGFSTLAWTGIGLDGRVVGALWALGVGAEIILFAVSGRLPLGPTALLGLGAAAAAIRWVAMALDPPTYALPVLQCLHGVSFGATHLGALQFLARAAPDGLAATAQGYLAVALGAGMAASTVLAGVLYGAFGSASYGAMALMAAIGGAFALAAYRRGREPMV